MKRKQKKIQHEKIELVMIVGAKMDKYEIIQDSFPNLITKPQNKTKGGMVGHV